MSNRVLRIRLRPGRDDDIQEILDELEDGDVSEFVRDAIREKQKDGLDAESILSEIRQLLKQGRPTE